MQQPQDEPAKSSCQKMLWFTAMGAGPHNDYEDFIQAALLSAKEHAPSLVPVLLFCGEPNELTRWFERNGGTVIQHHASFLDEFDVQPNVAYRDDLKRHEGAFLRLDIPLVMDSIVAEDLVDLTNVSTTHVLYTDADVMFVGDDVSTCTMPLPEQLSMSPQHVKGRPENSGVMVFNVPSFREEFPSFLQHGREQKFKFVYDNGWLTSYREGKNKTWGALPDTMNWKAYWGGDADVTILHWHGPKPRRQSCIECFLKHGRQEGWEKQHGCEKCLPIYVGMVNMGNASDGGDMYARMLDVFEGYSQQAQRL
ncbi:hypothetical protein N2152v2_001928 [Parachlorella kessleri]